MEIVAQAQSVVRDCNHDGCKVPVMTDRSYCIFHEPHSVIDVEQYTRQFEQLIKGWQQEGLTHWNFEGFQFPDKFDLRKYSLPRSVSFYRARFRGDFHLDGISMERCIWREAEFSGRVRIGNMVFGNESDFYKVKCSSRFELHDVTFESVANLLECSFRTLILYRCTIPDQLMLSGTSVYRCVRVSHCGIGSIDISNGQFTGDFEVEDSTLSLGLMFSHCDFASGLSVKNTRVEQSVECTRCKFGTDTVFESVIFPETVDFNHNSFCTACIIRDCDADGTMRLIWPGWGQPHQDHEGKRLDRGTLMIEDFARTGDSEINLCDTHIAQDTSLVFKDCDMSNVLLSGTNTEEVTFINCRNWPVIGGRQALRDEIGLRYVDGTTDNDWWKLAATYQGLARNFYDRDFHLSNSFQAGVFEARRIAAIRLLPKRGWSDYTWMTLYKLGSNYGTSISRPLTLVLLSLVLFPLAYWLTSIRPEISQWPHAFNLGLQIATLVGASGEISRGDSLLFNLLVVFQIVITFSLLSLFLLALKKTFRHK